MRINFRQGISTYPSTGVNQTFLVSNGSSVSLRASLSRVDIAFAQGSSNYLLTESTDVDNAWVSLPINTDCWLYWDINPLTGERTFGFTMIAPVIGSIAPMGTVGLMWFDTASTTMYEFTGATMKRPVIRVFAAKVNNSTFTPLGTGFAGKPFAGTQVGISGDSVAVGRIIADDTGRPIRRPNGTLFTTEDDFFVDGSPVNAVRIDATVVNGEALQNMAKFQVVKFSEFGKIEPAGYNDTQTTAIAMLLEDLAIQSVGTVCVQGKITNPDWNWTTVGAELWISENGEMTETDPHVSNSFVFPVPKPAVARVITPDTVIFDQGLGGKGERGASGLSGGVEFATPVIYGVARLTVPAADGEDPVVVGTNDPRLNDKVFRTGDTMTGPLILSGAPTQALGAATKQYVDSRTLDNLADVVTAGAVATNALVFDGTNWVPGSASGGAELLDDLTDVTITGVASGDQLVFNGTTWINQPGIETLNELSDVDTAGVAIGNALVFDGTNWVPGAPVGEDTVFVFQVGIITQTEHIHYAPMTAAQAQALIAGTNPLLPVGDVAQPSVVISAVPNNNPGGEEHTHDITVVYDYDTQTFLVTDISNNENDNHAALLVGKGGGGGDSLWTVATHTYAPVVTFPTVRLELDQAGSVNVVSDFAVKTLDLTLGDTYTVEITVDGISHQYSFVATGAETVQSVVNAINASVLNQHIVASIEVEPEYIGIIRYTGIEPGVLELGLIDNITDPFVFASEVYNEFYGSSLPLTTPGTYDVKVAEGLQPITGQVGAPEEVYLTLPTYVESNPVSPIVYDTWTVTTPHGNVADDRRLGRSPVVVAQPTGAPQTFAYTGGSVESNDINPYGSTLTFAYVETRYTSGATGGQLVDLPGYSAIGIYDEATTNPGGFTLLRSIDVGDNVVLLLESLDYNNYRPYFTVMSLSTDLTTLNGSLSYFAESLNNMYSYEYQRPALSTDPTTGDIAFAFGVEQVAPGDPRGFTLVKMNSSLSPIWSITTVPWAIRASFMSTKIDPTTGDVFFLATYGYDVSFTYLARFSAANGTPIWEQMYTNEAPLITFMGTDMEIDSANNRLYVGGSVIAGATGDGLGSRVGALLSLNATTGARVWARQINVNTGFVEAFNDENRGGKLAFDGTSIFFALPCVQTAGLAQDTALFLSSFTLNGDLNWNREFGRYTDNTTAGYAQFERASSDFLTNGGIAVNDTSLIVSFTLSRNTNFGGGVEPRMSLAALNKNSPAFGSNADLYQVVAGVFDGVVDVTNTFLVPDTTPIAAGSPAPASVSTALSFSFTSATVIDNAFGTEVISPGPGYDIPVILPSLEVQNMVYAGTLKVGDLLPPPPTLVGTLQDQRGMLRFNESGLYYCFADYNGLTDVWKRIPFTNQTLVFSYANSSITALPEHAENIVLMVSDSSISYRIPADDTIFPVGTTIVVGQDGLGQVTIEPVDSYSTIIRSPETNRTRKQFGKVTLIKTAANQWDLEGNLELSGALPGPQVQ